MSNASSMTHCDTYSLFQGYIANMNLIGAIYICAS